MTTTQGPINVLLVDDDPTSLQALHQLLSDDEGISVLRDALSADEAVDRLRESRPDVVMLDVGLAQTQCANSASAFNAMLRDFRVLLMANSGDLESSASLVTLEILGVLLKTADPQEIRRAVREAASGRPVFTSELALRLAGLLSEVRDARV